MQECCGEKDGKHLEKTPESHILLNLYREYYIRLAIAALVFAVYLFLPTKNYYWDGVSFAQTIEDAARWPALLHPNHLLYNVIGWAAYHALGASVRALYVLRALNSACAAAAVYLSFGIVARVTGSTRAALLLSLFFAFSGTWWRFATDADAYIPSITLLIASGSLLLQEKPRTVPAALLYCGAMLIHQLAFLFFPAALVALWRARFQQKTLYILISGGATLSAYAAAFYAQTGGFTFDGFRHWILSHAVDASFSFRPPTNLAISARSWVQLLLAGRPSLLDYSNPLTIALLALCATPLVFAVIAFCRQPRIRFAIHEPAVFRVAVVWIAVYAVFLFFWLPHNTFYKLFALPGLVLLIASCTQVSARAAAFVAAMALSNLTFAIIPYSRITANEAIAFAFRLQPHFPKGSTVYFWNLNTDDWFARYFNPQTVWRQAASPAAIGEGWLETTAIDHFSSTDPAWLAQRTAGSERLELVNAKQRIRFVHLLPLTTESDAERKALRER
jgi:hypothetical protein